MRPLAIDAESERTSPTPPARSERGKRSQWSQLLEIVAVFSPALCAVLGFRLVGATDPMLFIAAVWCANVAMLGLIALFVRIRGQSWDSIGVSFARPTLPGVVRTVIWSVPIFVVSVSAFVAGSVVMSNVSGEPAAADMTQYNYLQGNLPLLLLSLLSVYVVSSFGEEVVYRGFLISRLESLCDPWGPKWSATTAVIVSSAIFGAAHFEWGLTGIVQTTCMGAALGVSFLLSRRNLWPLILAHGYMDTLLLVQLYFAVD